MLQGQCVHQGEVVGNAAADVNVAKVAVVGAEVGAKAGRIQHRCPIDQDGLRRDGGILTPTAPYGIANRRGENDIAGIQRNSRGNRVLLLPHEGNEEAVVGGVARVETNDRLLPRRHGDGTQFFIRFRFRDVPLEDAVNHVARGIRRGLLRTRRRRQVQE